VVRSGQLIILLVDRQTTGGYPKIATIIAPDVAAMAQVKPGNKLRFRAIAMAEALAARSAMAEWLAALRPGLTVID